MKNENDYTTTCDQCGRGTWYETEQRCRCDYPKSQTCETCGRNEEILDEDGCCIMERCKGTLKLINP